MQCSHCHRYLIAVSGQEGRGEDSQDAWERAESGRPSTIPGMSRHRWDTQKDAYDNDEDDASLRSPHMRKRSTQLTGLSVVW